MQPMVNLASAPTPEANVQWAHEVARRLGARVRTAVRGRDEVIDLVLTALLADGHVLLEDYPGSGKTTLARALGSADALTTQLRTLMADAGLPTSLAAIGMPREGVGRAVELALKASYPNPRPLERAPLTQALEAAIEGTPWNDCPDGAGGKYNGK